MALYSVPATFKWTYSYIVVVPDDATDITFAFSVPFEDETGHFTPTFTTSAAPLGGAATKAPATMDVSYSYVVDVPDDSTDIMFELDADGSAIDATFETSAIKLGGPDDPADPASNVSQKHGGTNKVYRINDSRPQG